MRTYLSIGLALLVSTLAFGQNQKASDKVTVLKTLKTDTVTNVAGTGAPTFTQGVGISAGKSLTVDSIVNAAGNAAPAFPYGYGGNIPDSVVFTAWNPANNTGSLTNASARTVQIAGNNGVTISAIAGGVVTATYAKVGTYRLDLTAAHVHANSYTDASTRILVGGTASAYGNGGIFTVPGAINSNDHASGFTYFISVTSANQTTTIQPQTNLVSGNAATSSTAYAAFTITRL